MVPDRIRVGLVGANGGEHHWGVRAHIPALKALPEAQLTAVCTAHRETAKRAQERTGATFAYWDYREMVESPHVDLVSVAVRVSQHHPIAMASLKAGKHVFSEWPLALDSSQASAMHELAQARGLFNAVGTQARFSPGLMYAKELIEEGYVGTPSLFNARHFLPFATQPRASDRWWALRPEEGGGAILIAGGHTTDVIRWILGDIEEVSAEAQTLVRETMFHDTGEVVSVTAEDTIAFLARLQGGLSGVIHVSNACVGATGFRLEVYGSRGYLRLSTPNWVQYSPAKICGSRDGADLHELEVPPRYFEVTDLRHDSPAYQLAQLLRRFFRHIKRGGAFEPTFAEGLSLHHIMEAVVRSSQRRTWERVGR